MCRPATHASGTLVEVRDRDGNFVGRGIYNRKSQIALRLLTEEATQPLDMPYLERLLDRAVRFRRAELKLDAVTNAYRVVHSEGDGLSGLVVDRFAEFAVIELFSAGWFRQLKWLIPALAQRLDDATVLVRADRRVEELEGFRVRDFTAERLGAERLQTTVREHGLKFSVDLWHGHKTGFFCDQRPHRLRVRALAAGRRVLDGCCYSGGFALNAAHGGATSVTAIDLDEKAVAVAVANAKLNRLTVDFHHADLYDFLRAASASRTHYDLIVLDPPKFAAGRKDVAAALKRYHDLNLLAFRVLDRRGTLVTCSCSGAVSDARFRGVIVDAARAAGVAMHIVEPAAADAGPDHPARSEFPEGRYLKVYTCERG